jgi:hypothetical protein
MSVLALKFSRNKPTPQRSGQVMVLTVLTLGGALLGATTIAGLLMLYQIRQGADVAQSARAVFAADSGIEWGLYNLLCQTDPTKAPCPIAELPTFRNGATVEVKCLDDNGIDVPLCDPATTVTIKSLGRSANVARAFCALSNCDGGQ